ncbi:MAG: hypothetical protein AAGA57_04410 [Planctomycetota bacterium]
MTRPSNLAALACTAATFASASASAQVVGEFVLIEDDLVALNGTADIWAYRVTNDTASDIRTMRLEFTGDFISGAASLAKDPFISNPAPGLFLLETWFVGNGNATPIGIDIIDDGTTLAGDIGIAAPNVYIPAGTTGTAAIFSVAPDAPPLTRADNFVSGSVVIDGQTVPIPKIIPEPASAALLTLALPIVARRRRA